VIVPGTRCGPFQLLHPSFREFLVDRNRCIDINFAVNARLNHTLLAKHCLRVLKALSPDICKIGDPSLYNQEVVDLPDRIAACIPPYIQYGSRHWASHLINGDIHDAVLDLLLEFCSNQLLNWLEVMSFLGELVGAIAALQSVHRIVKVRHLLIL
jgi:hypothetical protein